MEVRQFTYINMVAECGSITKAAGRLFISQPALSNYISKLEKDLGVRLFDRSANPMKLTYAGERYLEHAKSILLEMDDMEREIRDISNHHAGRLRLGFPNERIIYMLPILLPAFQALYPEIRVETVTGAGDKLIQSLIAGDVDFVFLPMWDKQKGISQFKISEEELLLVAANGYLKDEYILDKERRIFDWKRITELPLLTLSKGHALRSCVDTLLKGNQKKANIFMESHSNMLSCRLASQGVGVTVVPEISLEMVLREGDAQWYHLSEYPVTWEINALYREDAYIGKVEQDFLQISRELFGEHKKKL